MLKKMLASGAVKLLGLELVRHLLDSFLLPKARAYVAKTSNGYDDLALEKFESLLKDILADLEK